VKENVEDETKELMCRDETPRDFLTLLRYTIMYKLSNQGNMFVRSFLSACHKFVFVVLVSS